MEGNPVETMTTDGMIPIKRQTLKALIVLNIVTLVLLAIVVAAGGSYFWMTSQSATKRSKAPSWDAIDQKLERRIGTPYDKGLHDHLMKLLRGSEEIHTKSIETSEVFSRLVMQTGGFCLLGLGASLFLLLRHRPVGTAPYRR